MLASFMLALREGVEGALIVGVLLGSLNALDFQQGKRSVWWGVILAVLGSIAAGLIAYIQICTCIGDNCTYSCYLISI